MTLRLHLATAPLTDMPAADDAIWRSRLDRAELAYCSGRRRAAEHLAARALARRAVAAALAWPGDVPWREITIRREPTGRPSVLLSSALTAWRYRHGLAVPGVSLSHAGDQAAALAWLPWAGRGGG